MLAGLGVASAAGAQESEAPDVEFLEYLGSWQETDEEWLIVAEWEDEDEGVQDERPRLERKDDE